MGYDAPEALHSLENIHNLQDVNTQIVAYPQNEGAIVNQQTPNIRAGEVIDRLRQAAEMPTDIALGEHFGLGSSAVSSWRARRKVPYEQCVILAIRKGLSLDWLLLGQGPCMPEAADVAEARTHGDPRAERLLRFVAMWQASHDSDEMAWLERTIARAVPEYGEWLAAQKD